MRTGAARVTATVLLTDPEAEQELQLRLPALARLRVEIRDERGRAPRGTYRVNVRHRDGTRSIYRAGRGGTLDLGDVGAAEPVVLAVYPRSLSWRAQGVEPLEVRAVELRPGEERTVHFTVPSDSGRLLATVREADGAPAAALLVRVRALVPAAGRGDPGDYLPYASGQTDAEGEVAFEGLPEDGRYLVEVRGQDYRPITTAEAPQGSHVTLTLPEGALME